MVLRIFRLLSSVTALALCPCVCAWAAPRHGGGAGHSDSRAEARVMAGGARGPAHEWWGGAPRQAPAGGAHPPFVPGASRHAAPPAPQLSITPISSHAGRPPRRAPNSVTQARSGSIRADVARYNEERPFHPDQHPRAEPAGLRPVPAFSATPYSGN